MDFKLRLFDDTIDKSLFSCTQKNGSKPLERFLSVSALDNQKKHLSAARVAVDGNRIAGYFSLSAASISILHMDETDRNGFP